MTQFFRANVGAVLCDADGRVLALERSDVPGAWQLPQGGLEEGEDPESAVLREVREESGIVPSVLSQLGRHPELLAYELPEPLRSRKTGRGQVQYWFYLRLRESSAAEPKLPADGEFRAWRWMELRELARSAVDFRRPTYEKLAKHFEREIRPKLG